MKNLKGNFLTEVPLRDQQFFLSLSPVETDSNLNHSGSACAHRLSEQRRIEHSLRTPEVVSVRDIVSLSKDLDPHS